LETIFIEQDNKRQASQNISDANGNQIKRIVGTDTFDLKYDAENRLVEVKKNSTVVASFAYDADGRRVKSIMGTETTLFIGAHYQVANPDVPESKIITKYYFAGAQRVATPALAPGASVRTCTTPTTCAAPQYLLSDHLGSTSLVVKDTITGVRENDVISELRYTAWGEVRYSNGTTPTDYTYTGQYSNVDDFGLMFYNARWYDPALGRFAQADTIVPGGVQGLDRYAYVSNNPLRYIDPTGHMMTEDEGGGGDGSYGLAFLRSRRERERSQQAAKRIRDQMNRCETFASCNGGFTGVFPAFLPPVQPMCIATTGPQCTAGDHPEISQLESLLNQVGFSVDTMELIEVVEEGIQWGRPVYKQIKYAIPLGGLEYGFDATLQLHDDRSMHLTLYQRALRAGVRYLESFAIDGASSFVGTSAATALQLSAPEAPVVAAGTGYIIGSYSTSAILENWATQKNPALFSSLGLGGP
jgi:RHS repeat-associated protein